MKTAAKKNRSPIQLKKVFKTFFKSSAVLAVIYCGFLLKQIELPEVMPLEDIVVTGELRYLDKNKILATLKQDIDGGYFTVDLVGLRDKLMQQPWVKDVSLRRQWPASIHVSIKEEVPVAYWNEDAYISESGEVFTPEKRTEELMLPALNGPEGHHAAVWKFMNQLYSEMVLQEYQVVRLDLDDRRAWQMVIAADNKNSPRIVVKLGRFETAKRLRRFVRILPVLITRAGLIGTGTLAEETIPFHAANDPGIVDMNTENKKLDVIDMRYPNGFAVQLSSKLWSSKPWSSRQENEA